MPSRHVVIGSMLASSILYMPYLGKKHQLYENKGFSCSCLIEWHQTKINAYFHTIAFAHKAAQRNVFNDTT